jgi:magnesium-transporting ATPase (P-type)
MYFTCTVPAIASGYGINENIGRALLKQVDLMVNETVIETLYDDWYISFYNLFFTSMPLMVRALFDQDINTRKDGEEYKRFLPKLYYIG